MYKLASRSFDLSDHIVNDELEKVSSVLEGISKEARSQEIPDIEQEQDLEDKDFALVMNHPGQGKLRKFGKYNKAITEANLAILDEKQDEMPEKVVKTAAANLGRSAKDYGIEVPESLADYVGDSFVDNRVDLSNIKEATNSKITDGSEEGPFALPDKKQYPLSSSNEIEKAAEYFDLNHSQFNPEDKVEFAENLVKEAENKQIEIEGKALKYANLDYSEVSEDFQYRIEQRKNYAGEHSEFTETYDQLLEKSAEMEPEKVAHALKAIDQRSGVWQSWGKGVADPLMATFDQEKTANKTIMGVYVSKEDLKNIDRGKLTELVGTQAVSELRGEDGVDVLESMPDPVKEEIVSIIQQKKQGK